MEIKNDITYPIEEIKEEGRALVIKAGKSWAENKVKKYEGIIIKIPKEIKNNKKTTFAVMNIKRKDYETYILHLHSHDFDFEDLGEQYEFPKGDDYVFIDAGGDVEVSFPVKIDLLSKWTKISERDIRNAFENINLGTTYNFLVSIPRTIVITKEEIILTFNPHVKVDTMNYCNLIFKNKHPIDN